MTVTFKNSFQFYFFHFILPLEIFMIQHAFSSIFLGYFLKDHNILWKDAWKESRAMKHYKSTGTVINYVEPGSKIKTVSNERVCSITEYSCFLPQFSSSVTQNLLHWAILKASKLKE